MRLMWGLLPPGAADHLAFDNRRCGVVPVEMPADDPEIAGVGAESEVEQVACYGNGAKRGIDRRIDAHARELPLRHAKIARFRWEERRVGKECVSTCRYRGSTDPSKKTKIKY